MSEATVSNWEPGDRYGVQLPAHPDALAQGGAEFLTRAFRASGALPADGRVTEITRFDEWQVGGTGPKVLLSVAYRNDPPNLSRDLFVKFSRSFTDRTRDGARYQMDGEVRLANLSRDAAFPVAVPACVFADFHRETGTGILITERIPYGRGSVEPHHHKAMDQILPDPLAHYRVLISTIALLSGRHKSRRLGEAVERDFPFDLQRSIANARNPAEPQQFAARIDRVTRFIAQYPHLVPPHLAGPDFLESVRNDAPLAFARQDAIRRSCLSRPEMIALCHPNANIDNAWFWREPDEALQCGLIDWGNVGQIHVCQAILGSLACSEPDLLDHHLGELLDLFIADYARAGGPALAKAELERHLDWHLLLGLPTTAPPAILREVPDPAIAVDRYDPIFTANETARVQLKVTINYLSLWHRRDSGRLLRSAGAA